MTYISNLTINVESVQSACVERLTLYKEDHPLLTVDELVAGLNEIGITSCLPNLFDALEGILKPIADYTGKAVTELQDIIVSGNYQTEPPVGCITDGLKTVNSLVLSFFGAWGMIIGELTNTTMTIPNSSYETLSIPSSM
jgi:phage-related protein